MTLFVRNRKKNDLEVLTAFVPLATMFSYIGELRSLSKGRATFSMEFEKYEPLPQNLADELTGKEEKAKGKKEQGKHDEKDAAENYEKHAEEIKEKDVKENKETGNNTVKGSNTVKGKNNVKGSNLMQRPAAARAREASAPALPTPPASLMEEALLAQLARE